MKCLRVGLVCELLGSLDPTTPGLPPDADAEYEPLATIEALEAAVRTLGHDPVRLGGPRALLAAGSREALPAVDVAWNIAEGYGRRNRESHAPVLLELLGIHTLGSDALTLSASLDKAWAQTLVEAAGVRVPARVVVESAVGVENLVIPAAYPLFVKPRWEGTAKGIRASSRVEDAAGLAREVARVIDEYRQPALVEAFISGPEYTVTMIGNDPPEVLPVLQRALEAGTGIGLHALEGGGAGEALEHRVPGSLDAALEAELGRLALRAYGALRCLDFARADFRLDEAGLPYFLEINPLPTFAPDGSFAILAELLGEPFETLLARVLDRALVRLSP